MEPLPHKVLISRRSRFQTYLANTQGENVLIIFSSAWSQKGQVDGWGRRLLARWSAVRHLCREQAKKMHLEEPNISKLFSREQTWWLPEKRSICRLAAIGTQSGQFPPILISTLMWQGHSIHQVPMSRYSVNNMTERAPFISTTQLLLFSSWATVRLFTVVWSIIVIHING